MLYEYGMASCGNAVCSVNRTENKAAAIELYAFGTEIHPDSICPDATIRSLKQVTHIFQTKLENCLQSNSSDLMYAAAHIMDALDTANETLRQISHFLGEGIYMGGNIAYCVDAAYLITSFGGSCAYDLQNGILTPIGKEPSTGLISDALGCVGQKWESNLLAGSLAPGESIFLITAALPHPETIPIETITSVSHRNTTAILLRRQLDSQTAAAVELRYRKDESNASAI